MMTRLEDNAPSPRGDQLLEGIDYDLLAYEETPIRTKIISELADRMQDLHDLDPRLSFKLIFFLLRVYQEHPSAFEIVVAILAGHRQGGKSLAVIGDEAILPTSKQNVHQTRRRLLELLAKTFPDLASTIAEILSRCSPREPIGERERGNR